MRANHPLHARKTKAAHRRSTATWRILTGVLVLGGCADVGTPGPGETMIVTAESLQTFATPEVIARVVDLQPDSSGRVWILNSLAPYFVVLAADGQVIREFGQRGGGPEEFGAPWALAGGKHSDEVWVYDVQRHALIRVSAEERQDLAFAPDSLPPGALISFKGAGINQAPPWLVRGARGFYMARSRSAVSETALQTWNADIVHIRDDQRAASPTLHTPIADLVGDPASKFGAASVLLPYPVWTVCDDGSVALYDPLGNTIRRITAGGQDSGAVTLPDERQIAVTVDRLFEMFYRELQENIPAGQLPDKEEARSLTQSQNEELVSTSASVFPEFTDMHCAADGTLWIRPFDVVAVRIGQGSEWIRIANDGSKTAVRLPNEFRTFRITSERIWGTIRDSMGVEAVAWVDLTDFR